MSGKITDKELSQSVVDQLMTSAEKTKLAGIAAGAQANTVTSVAGRTGAVVVAKADVGLGSVENYGIATQAEAEAGTSNAKYMTPLRTAEAIAKLAANASNKPIITVTLAKYKSFLNYCTLSYLEGIPTDGDFFLKVTGLVAKDPYHIYGKWIVSPDGFRTLIFEHPSYTENNTYSKEIFIFENESSTTGIKIYDEAELSKEMGTKLIKEVTITTATNSFDILIPEDIATKYNSIKLMCYGPTSSNQNVNMKMSLAYYESNTYRNFTFCTIGVSSYDNTVTHIHDGTTSPSVQYIMKKFGIAPVFSMCADIYNIDGSGYIGFRNTFGYLNSDSSNSRQVVYGATTSIDTESYKRKLAKINLSGSYDSYKGIEVGMKIKVYGVC